MYINWTFVYFRQKYILPNNHFYWTLALDVSQNGTFVQDVCTIFNNNIFSVSAGSDNMKDVLGVERVRLSHYKEANPTDSDAVQDIGLSSEDEAEDLPEVPTVRRKYQATSAPDPPPQPQPRSSTQPSTEPAAATASIQVPVEMLQQVHHAIG